MGLRKPPKGGGVELPIVENPATVNDIAEGKQAINDQGTLIEGVLMDCESGYTTVLSNAGPSHVSGNIRMTGTMSEDRILRSGSKVMTQVSGSYFGDAAASDVAAGKTFTSKNGLNMIGTGSIGGGTVTSETFTNTDRDSYGYPAIGTIQAKTGRTLWKDMFVCVTDIYIEPNSSNGVGREHALNISYDSSTGTVSLDIERTTNSVWNYGALKVTVYYIN